MAYLRTIIIAFCTFTVSMLLLFVKLPLMGLGALYAFLLLDNISVQLPRLFLMMAIVGQCYVLSCMLLPPILYPFITVLISSYVTLSAALSMYITVSTTDQLALNTHPETPSQLLQECNKNIDQLLSSMDVSPCQQNSEHRP